MFANCRRHGFNPGLRRSPGEGDGNPLQYSYLGNPKDRGAWRATVHEAAESQTRLNDFHWWFLTKLDIVLARVCVQTLSCVRLFAAPWTVSRQAPLSLGFPGQEYWSGKPFPPPGDLPDPGMEPMSLMSPALAGGFFTTGAIWEAPCVYSSCLGLPRLSLCLFNLFSQLTSPWLSSPWAAA